MRRLALILVGLTLWLAMPSAAYDATAFGPAEELLPAPTGGDSQLPPCRLTRTDTDLVISIGDRNIQRIGYRSGRNMVEYTNRFDSTLEVALRTVAQLRAAGACR